MEEKVGEIKKTETVDLEKETVTFISQFLIGATILVVLLILVSAGLLLAKKNSIKNLTIQIEQVDNQLKPLADLDKKLSAFSSALTNIDNALNQRTNWFAVFKELNNITPKDVVYTNFSVDENNQIKLDGNAPSLSSIARLIVALKQDKDKPENPNSKFQNINLSSVSVSEGKFNFSLTLSLTASALK